MLPHYSPLKVAETFSVLSGLYGDRIDLGIGRAPGTDPQTSFALQRDRRYQAIDDFPEQLAELTAYLDGTFPRRSPARAPLGEPAGPPVRPAAVAARLLAAERDLGGAARPAVLVRRLHQPGRAPRSRRSTASASRRRARSPSPSSRSRSRRSAPRRTRRPSCSPRARRWRSRCCAAAARAPCPRSRRATEFLSQIVPAELDDAPAAARRRHARSRPGRARGGRRGVRRRARSRSSRSCTTTQARRRSYELIAAEFGL